MDPYIGEIRIFAGDFAPSGWALCNGQLLPIIQNTALFAILGTTYGGDGKTNFALPNLQGRTPLHQGQGTGLTTITLGEDGGVATVTLSESQMPAHNHLPNRTSEASLDTPNGAIWADLTGRGFAYTSSPNTPMNPQAIIPTGGNNPHNNMQPYLGLTFIIALEGVFPANS